MKKALLIPMIALLSAVAAFFAFGLKDINTQANGLFSTAEIALDQKWIKGAAPILAANFDSVTITNLNKDVEESFVFDIALSEIYQINTDYNLPPVDLRSLNLEPRLRPNQQERSEIFCNLKDEKYCELAIYWSDAAPEATSFTAVWLDDLLFAIVENGLLADLGVRID